MKLRIVGLGMLMILGTISVLAQDTFSDEDLNKYATVMKWAAGEKVKMSAAVSAAVKESEVVSGAVYNKLSKAIKAGDVNSTDATQEEVDGFIAIQENTENSKAEFKIVYIEKIGSDIGNGLYNRLKKALKSDDEVKARYQAIFESIEMEETDESEK